MAIRKRENKRIFPNTAGISADTKLLKQVHRESAMSIVNLTFAIYSAFTSVEPANRHKFHRGRRKIKLISIMCVNAQICKKR